MLRVGVQCCILQDLAGKGTGHLKGPVPGGLSYQKTKIGGAISNMMARFELTTHQERRHTTKKIPCGAYLYCTPLKGLCR